LNVPSDQEEENIELFQASLSLTSFSSQVGLYQVLSYHTLQLQPAKHIKIITTIIIITITIIINSNRKLHNKKLVYKHNGEKNTSPDASSISASCSSFETLFPISGKA
jgi:hypothetical protein